MNEFSLATQEKAEVISAEATQVTTYDDDSRFIVDLTTKTLSYCSMTAETSEEKAKLYNAMNNPEKRIKDCVNLEINIKDVFVEVVKCVNKETGEAQSCPRVVLIDTKGIAYQSVSIGIFSALKKIFQVYGEPFSWDKPVKVRVKQINKGDRSLLTLDIVV